MMEASEPRSSVHKLHQALRTIILCMVICVIGCRGNITSLESAVIGHAVLVVRFSGTPDVDEVLVKNVLSKGGAITCGYDSDYVRFLRRYDEDFDEAAASNKDGKFSIHPAVLNWISSKGWKFQQKFCINLNDENAEYYFIK